MKRMVIIFCDIRKAFNYPLLFLSAALCVILLIKPNNQYALSYLFSAAFAGFYIYAKMRKGNYALAAGLIILSADILFEVLSDYPLSLIAIVLLTLLVGFIYKRFGFTYGSVISITSAFLIVILMSELHELIFSLTEKAAAILGTRGTAFGIVNSIYRLLIGNRLEELVYNTGFSKSVVINGEIVSGIKNIFAADRTNAAVAKFLTGRYYQSIFLSVGIITALIRRVSKDQRLALILLLLFTVLTGETALFELYILIYNPMLYFGYLGGVFISYTVSDLLNISIGFDTLPLITNLFGNFDKPVYFILSGFVIALIMYFLSNMILLKFDFQTEPYYPRRVKEILKYLGGADNIAQINEGRVYVNNPNLINILKLECEIKQNVVTLYEDDYDALNEYF